MGGSRTSCEEQGGTGLIEHVSYVLSLLLVILSAVFTLRHTFSPMKECVRHTDDALGDAWSWTSAFVCIGVFNRRLSVFTIFDYCPFLCFVLFLGSWGGIVSPGAGSLSIYENKCCKGSCASMQDIGCGGPQSEMRISS